ncbi:hypothetical protein U1Q18_033282 [Sarracenia purpurea var. burkii]
MVHHGPTRLSLLEPGPPLGSLVARPLLPWDSASSLGAEFDFVDLLCSAESFDSVGRPPPVADESARRFWPELIYTPSSLSLAVWTTGAVLGFWGGLCSDLIGCRLQ